MNIFKLSKKELEVYLKENIDTKKPSELLEELIECGLESGEVMEEDIKILEEFIKDYEATTDPLEQSAYFEEVPAKTIRNIINKYKEQEKIIDGVCEDYQDIGKELLKTQEQIEELEKIIDLMAKELAVCGGFDYVEFGMETGNFKKDINNMIDYFRKKAKGE